MKRHFAILGLLSILISCSPSKEKKIVTTRADYVRFLQGESSAANYKLARYDDEANFWNGKIKDQPKGYLYIQKLAAIKSQQFELTGDVKYLFESDSLFQQAAAMVSGKAKAGNLLSLSSNAIKEHQFQKALEYGFQSIGLTNEKFGPLMMMYDAYMELGEYDLAGSILKQNKRLDNFHYLVRLSKYQDHQGNLDSAIIVMEKAFSMIENKNNETSRWAQTNLADMYGHAGKLDKAYDFYLQVLDKDPNYLHALKGIAWLAYSNDRHINEAKSILNYIKSQTLLPDVHLTLAEIAEYENRPIEKNAHLKAFIEEAAKKKYLGMYNKYLIILYAEEFKDFERAITLAKKEVGNRPTPMTYSLLAWTLLQKGEQQQALDIIQEHVEGATFEPKAVYYIGMTYAMNGQVKEAKNYLTEASEADFELGPVTTSKIKQTLNKL